jgi:hypothetical protein
MTLISILILPYLLWLRVSVPSTVPMKRSRLGLLDLVIWPGPWPGPQQDSRTLPYRQLCDKGLEKLKLLDSRLGSSLLIYRLIPNKATSIIFPRRFLRHLNPDNEAKPRPL